MKWFVLLRFATVDYPLDAIIAFKNPFAYYRRTSRLVLEFSGIYQRRKINLLLYHMSLKRDSPNQRFPLAV
jgi:hypothetical protein